MSRDNDILKAVRFERADATPMVYPIREDCQPSLPREALHELMAEAGDTLTEEQILAFRSKQVATYGTRARRRATSPG